MAARAGLLDRVSAARSGAAGPRSEVMRYTPPPWMFDGGLAPAPYVTTLGTDKAEAISDTFAGYAANGLMANTVVAAVEWVRMSVFSEARFQFQQLRKGRPGNLFSLPDLDILHEPWPGGTTGDLLARMLLDADLAGNWFGTLLDGEIVRLRPDWVEIVFAYRLDADGRRVGVKRLGYLYYEGGKAAAEPPAAFLVGEVAHFAPKPDPLANFRGMSWLTPVVREIQADTMATRHKLKFFENAATPNLAVSLAKEISPEAFETFVAKMDLAHKGIENAYKTLYTGGGADVTVVGADMRQLDFKTTQGAGEPLALDTPIPTPMGWTTMGGIATGDQVIGRDGSPANVVGVSPVHLRRDCYRIALKDRTEMVADASHLWVAVDRGSASRAEKTYTTQELYDLHRKSYPNGVGGHRMSLPAAPIVELPEVDLLVDPYVLGAWLGDGHTAGAAICGADDDLKYVRAEVESRGYSTTTWSTAADKVAVFGVPGGLLAALRALGVLGSKHIPTPYLRSSVAQRLDLLRGLMDTDGTIDEGRGGCQYSSKDEHLARQVAELLRSLGYKATVSYSTDPRSRTGRSWKVHFRVAQDRIPFLLPRKVDRSVAAGEPYYSDQRSIVAIEPVPSVPVCCIAVDTEDHLFLAGEGFVPTHNTRIAAAGGVHPAIVALSEGMQGASLNAGNFAAARRLVSDVPMRSAWRNAAGSLEVLVPAPAASRLWYDDRDVAFLREDAKDAAEIAEIESRTIGELVRNGFTQESARDAVLARNMDLLVPIPGWVSVQLQPGAAGVGTAPAVLPANGTAPPNGSKPALTTAPGG